MSDTKSFRHKATGRVGTYPAHFSKFSEFEEVSSEPCVDCEMEEPDLDYGYTEAGEESPYEEEDYS